MKLKQSNLAKSLMGGAATSLVMALGLGGVAIAQESADTPTAEATEDDEAVLDVVSVTGIRGSIQNSLNAKKNANSIVEAISAEDIGKLPDLSIADSLARLPGVTAQRVRGRAQQISIRGLGPDFSLALLNGREIVSAGNNRGIEFDQFPSELVAQGLVYKTPDATLAATGIAGAVDLRTIKPLDYSDRQINVSGRYVWNDNDQFNPDFESDGYRLFGSYIDQTADGTVGWYIGGTVQSNPTQFTSRELKTGNFQTGFDATTGLTFPSDNPRTGVVSRDFERTSVAGALQFEPNESFAASFDAFYTDTEDAGIFRGVETPIATWASAGATSIEGTGDFANRVTYEQVPTVLRTDTESASAEIFAIGANFDYKFSDSFSVNLDVAHSNLDRSDIDYESYGALASGLVGSGDPLTDTLTFTLPGDGEYSIDSIRDYTDPNAVFLIDPGGWTQVGFINQPEVTDELNQIRLEAEKELDVPFISGITGGVRYTEREKDFINRRQFIRANSTWVAGPNGALVAPISASTVIGQTNDGGTGIPIIAYNPAGLVSDGTYTLDPASNPPSWIVEEEVLTLYAMANIDDEWNGVPVRGNFGFQYIDTDQASTGTLAGVGTQTIEESYDNFLPSANLSFEIQEDTFLRFAAARSLTRARLDQLAANQDLMTNPAVCQDTDADGQPDSIQPNFNPAGGFSCFSLNGGNPNLQPYLATGYDIAFEKYFGPATALSVAVFHKELEDWVLNETTLTDASQQIIASGLGDFLAANPQIATVRQSAPTNFAEGSITGFEVTLRMSLDEVLPEQFAGFGFNASFTSTDNSLSNNGVDIEIPGYSDETWSGDVYYENHGWRARVSTRYRSGFPSEVIDFGNNLISAQALEETIVDAQIGYEWDDGPLQGFSVNLEAFNLTDEASVTIDSDDFNGAPSPVPFPSRHELYGTTYNLTIAKKF